MLSGRGPVGIGWSPALWRARRAGVDVAEADVIAGTSAGSVVGAQVALGRDVAKVAERITVDGRRYVDGGMRSMTNADLAKGHGRVHVLSVMNPSAVAGPLAALAAGVEDEVATLRDAGGEVELVFPDGDAAGAIGINLMDPAGTGPAIKAGVRQGSLLANTLAAFCRVEAWPPPHDKSPSSSGTRRPAQLAAELPAR